MTTPDYKLEYPELSLRRYGVVIHNGPNLTLVDPVEPAVARAYLTTQKQLREAVQQFILTDGANSDLVDFSHRRTLILGTDGDGKPIRKSRLLHGFEAQELYAGLEARLKSRSNFKVAWGSPERAIDKLRLKDKTGFSTHSEGVTLSGRVASKSRGWHEVNIVGPYRSSKHPLVEIRCGCADSRYVSTKLGYQHLTHLDFHAALLLAFAEQNPGRLQGLERQQDFRGELRYFRPFEIDSGTMVEVLLAKYVEGRGAADISKTLLRRTGVYSAQLVGMLRQGRASYQAVPNEDFTNTYEGALLQLYRNIAEGLKRRSFKLTGYVLEKKGTDYEVVALNFEREGKGRRESARIITKDGPPLIIWRTVPLGQDFGGQVNDFVENPWEELYVHKQQGDDKTRMVGNYTWG